MKNTQRLNLSSVPKIVVFSLTMAWFGIATCLNSVLAQPSDSFTSENRESEFYDTLPGTNDKGSILDATNPMDLINRLQRATAMDKATSPSDAVDQALKALDEQALRSINE